MQLEGQTSVKGKYGSYQLLFLSLTLIFSLEKWVCHYDFSHKRKWAWFPLNKIINKDFKQVSSTKYIPSENTLACCSDSVLILQTWYLRVGKTRTKTNWDHLRKSEENKCKMPYYHFIVTLYLRSTNMFLTVPKFQQCSFHKDTHTEKCSDPLFK